MQQDFQENKYVDEIVNFSKDMLLRLKSFRVQFDASSPSRHGSSVRMMKLVNKLLEAIPDSIPFGGTI
eukprot:gene42042-55792_t